MPTKTLEELADGFALFDNWEDRYRYLIDLGQHARVLRLNTGAHLWPLTSAAGGDP